MAAVLAASMDADCPGGRGFRCNRRKRALRSSILFLRTVAVVKNVKVMEIETAGPLCTQCGTTWGMYTPIPGERGHDAYSLGIDSTRP